ncbi:MAG TPA: hypothetical protein VNH46_06925, partial [Gemmatimonadales bacterium]|nr:hypothetical protein [Gemmatimonadales bacterium]
MPAITASDLESRLYAFADDSMEGREAGTAGGARATRYLAREARRLGLVPAGDSGSYFQTVPVIRRRVAPHSTLRVANGELRLGTDWTAAAIPGTPLHRDRIGVVYGGTLTFSTSPLRPGVTLGKLVIFEPRRQVNR